MAGVFRKLFTRKKVSSKKKNNGTKVINPLLYGRVPSAIPRPISRGTVERRKRNRIKPVKPKIQRKIERIPTADEWGAFDTTRRIKPVKPIIQRKHTMRRPIRPILQDRKTPFRKKSTMPRRTINIG